MLRHTLKMVAQTFEMRTEISTANLYFDSKLGIFNYMIKRISEIEFVTRLKT